MPIAPRPPGILIIPPGGSPAAAFVSAPVVGDGRPPGILADAVDPTTGEILSLFAGVHPVDGAFLHQLSIRAESGPAVNGGQRFDSIRKNVDDTDKRLRFEAQRIAKPFVDRGWLTLTADANTTNAATGEPTDQANVLITFTNRFTTKPVKVPK